MVEPITPSPQKPRGGHMLYDRTINTTKDGKKRFLKKHDASLFTDPARELHSRQYIDKEKRTYAHLRDHGYRHAAKHHDHPDETTLELSVYHADDGWFWRAPRDPELYDRYMRDIMSGIRELNEQPSVDYPDIRQSHITFDCEGWQDYPNKKHIVTQVLAEHRGKITNELLKHACLELTESLDALYNYWQLMPECEVMQFSHHDFRQSNIAWHPSRGLRIIDWSWADLGEPGSDATSLIIDLHKHGYDISQYMQEFNVNHAVRLIGFWLLHGILPAREPDSTVRFQQLQSAVAAYSLVAPMISHSSTSGK